MTGDWPMDEAHMTAYLHTYYKRCKDGWCDTAHGFTLQISKGWLIIRTYPHTTPGLDIEAPHDRMTRTEVDTLLGQVTSIITEVQNYRSRLRSKEGDDV